MDAFVPSLYPLYVNQDQIKMTNSLISTKYELMSFSSLPKTTVKKENNDNFWVMAFVFKNVNTLSVQDNINTLI